MTGARIERLAFAALAIALAAGNVLLIAAVLPLPVVVAAAVLNCGALLLLLRRS